MSKRKAKKTAIKTKPKTFKTVKAAARAIKRRAKKPETKPGPGSHSKLFQPTRLPSQIKVGKRFRQDTGDLKALARSIDDRGALLEPVVIDSHNKLIDGERRLLAWGLSKSAGKQIPVHVVDIDSLIAGEYDANAERKNFNPSELVAIKRALAPVLAKAAKARMEAGKKADPSARGRAGELVAKATGKSRRTIDKAEAVVDAAEKDPAKFGKLKAQMDKSGKVNGPFKRLQIMQQSKALREAPAPLPMRGPYHAIVVDFPWPAEKGADQADIDKRGRAMRDYPEMSIEEGCKLFRSKEFQELLAPDCRVYFCTTNHHIDDAFTLLRAMGFPAHSTIGTWRKNKHGRGQVLFGKTEQCILAERGKPVTSNLDAEGKVLTTDWAGEGWEVREDSRKPEAFYALVEQNTPAPRYAEIFSRGGRNEKWDCHGDQAGKFAPSIDKGAQAEILKEVKLSPNEQLLAVLEAIEEGKTPDLRLVDKSLQKQIDRCVEGKQKFKLSARGKDQIKDLRERRGFLAAQADLPDDPALLETEYLEALNAQHSAILAKDKKSAERFVKRLDVIAAKRNGGELPNWRQCAADHPWSPAFAAPVGHVPMWGQPGFFDLDVDGLMVLVKTDHDGNFDIFATNWDREWPFRKSGYDYITNVNIDEFLDDWKAIAGLTVDQFVAAEIRENIKACIPAVKGGKFAPWQRPPEKPVKVYALPESWDGSQKEPKPLTAKQLKEWRAKNPPKLVEVDATHHVDEGFVTEKEKKALAKGKKKAAPKAKTVGRTLPGRDAELIEFAERKGHTVSMTIDHGTDENVGTCQCGAFIHREKRVAGASTPAIMKKRKAAVKRMDDAITTHWAEQKSKTVQPTAEVTAAEPARSGDGATAEAAPAGVSAEDDLSIPPMFRRMDEPKQSTDPKGARS